MKPFLPHGCQVHRRRDSDQRLVGADVGGGFLAADVLLPGLEREDESSPSIPIEGHPHQSTWELPHVLLPAGQVSEIGPAVVQPCSQGLALAGDDVGAILPRRTEQTQSDRVGRHRA